MQRIGLVHPDAAVQMVQHPHRRWQFGGDPVGGDVEIVRGVETFGQAPDRRQRRDVQGAGGDVDVGDLLCDGLEGRERLAELMPLADVLRGEFGRPGEQSVGEGRHGGERDPVERHHGVGAGSASRTPTTPSMRAPRTRESRSRWGSDAGSHPRRREPPATTPASVGSSTTRARSA